MTVCVYCCYHPTCYLWQILQAQQQKQEQNNNFKLLSLNDSVRVLLLPSYVLPVTNTASTTTTTTKQLCHGVFLSRLMAWPVSYVSYVSSSICVGACCMHGHCTLTERSKCRQHNTSKIHIAFHNEANVSTTHQKYTLHFTSLRFTECAMLKAKNPPVKRYGKHNVYFYHGI